MKQSLTFLILLSILILLSCNDSKPEVANSADHSSDTSQIKPVPEIKKAPTKLIVNLDNLRLRAAPGTDGKEIARLSKGTVLIEMGEISDFTTKTKIRGIPFNEPWIKVNADAGLEGWVYGAGVSFDIDDPGELAKKILSNRLHGFFGNEITSQMETYKKMYDAAATASDFEKAYIMGDKLRDTLVQIMENKFAVDDPSRRADMFWLEGAMPGYSVSLAAEGTLYYLFRNYKKMLHKAQSTQGPDDNEFIKLNTKIYAVDSIEYFYPEWFMQTWDYGGHSLLGQGKHLEILGEMDLLTKKSDLFSTFINEIKEALVNDITDVHVSYWETKEKILKELDEILASEIQLLTSVDRIAIQTKRKLFEAPEKHEISINNRAGSE